MTMPAASSKTLVPPSVRLTACHADDAFRVIPSEVTLGDTVRSPKFDLWSQRKKQRTHIAASVAAAFGGVADDQKRYPGASNQAYQADFCPQIAALLVGPENDRTDFPSVIGAEVFRLVSRAVRDSFIFFGNGPSANLHSVAYRFNEDAVVLANEIWIKTRKRSFQAETRRD